MTEWGSYHLLQCHRGITQLAIEKEHTGRSNQILNLSAWKRHVGYAAIQLARTSHKAYLATKGPTSIGSPVTRREVKWFVRHVTLSLPQKDIKRHSLWGRKERGKKGSSVGGFAAPSFMLRLTWHTLCLNRKETYEPDAMTPISYVEKRKHSVVKHVTRELNPGLPGSRPAFLSWPSPLAPRAAGPLEVPPPTAGPWAPRYVYRVRTSGHRSLHFKQLERGLPPTLDRALSGLRQWNSKQPLSRKQKNVRKTGKI